MPTVLRSEDMETDQTEGIIARRIFQITEIDNVRQALESGPEIGETHPDESSIRVVNKKVRTTVIAERTVWELEVEYRTPGSGEDVEPGEFIIEIAGAGSSETTSTDINGNLIAVSHEVEITDPERIREFLENEQADTPPDEREAIESIFASVTQVHPVSRIKPSAVFRATERIEGINPVLEAQDFVGVIDATEQWLCTRVDARSEDGGATYLVTYEYQFNRDGWNPVVEWIDPETRAAPEDLEDGVGRARFQIYPIAALPHNPAGDA